MSKDTVGGFSPFTVRSGRRHLFWGTTESVRLVDLTNQTHLAGCIDGESKLGRQMIQLSRFCYWRDLNLLTTPCTIFGKTTVRGSRGSIRCDQVAIVS
ncbi:MAG: hypothetical protein OEV49_12310 [candidate division Zixibacteria bacterium]|nr:hypothetical protein [candidate division Zixibacteria bacterium]MDH3935940.1 hypothetical protein [candidate division Zixibacteria bacterium]